MAICIKHPNHKAKELQAAVNTVTDKIYSDKNITI